MDPNILNLAVAGGLTLVCVVITALIWRRAQVKTVFWWLGLTLVPLAVYLLGLAPAVLGAYDTLRVWWGTLAFTPVVWTGLVLGGLGAALMLGSRLIPSESWRDRRAARRERAATAATAGRPGAPAVASGTGAGAPGPAAPATPARPPAGAPAPATGRATPSDEYDEVTEILRKRGIS